MTDIFISYKREDREAAKALAETLAAHGYEPWWDVNLLPGAKFADEIAAIIKRSRATIVLWSRLSVISDFVRAEANLARQHGTLIPARLDDCEIPIPFSGYHTLDLTNWDGGSSDIALDPLISAVKDLVPPLRQAPDTTEKAQEVLRDPEREALFWKTISSASSQSVHEYQHYLDQFGNDASFADLAQIRIDRLKNEKKLSLKKIMAGATAAVALSGGILGVILNAEKVGIGNWLERIVSLDYSTRKPHAEQPAETGAHNNSASTQVAVGRYPKQPGETFRDCTDCPLMVVVPPGEFLRGSPDEEEGRMSDEGPRRRVEISKPFAVGKFEVTRDQFDVFVRATEPVVPSLGCAWEDTGKIREFPDGLKRPHLDPGFSQSGDEPVVCVSWEEAKSYVAWLSGRTGKTYRLLSEAEWEYVARAGTDTPFFFGSTITTDQANYDGTHTYDGGPTGRFLQKTATVGSYPPNAFGVHDMHGNVWEWTEDCWSENYFGVPVDGSAWMTGDCRRRVVRGGGWPDKPDLLRSANRSSNIDWSNEQGFRVAMTLER